MAKPKRVRIKDGQSAGRTFVTTTARTSISQRETLETIIENLATALGYKSVLRLVSARDATFYAFGPSTNMVGPYQSASNTILALSEALLEAQHAKAGDEASGQK